MGPRPTDFHISLPGEGPGDLPPPPRYQMDLPSPRTGEIPPALSPLDAFAMQSRMLARKFQMEAQSGRRISRIPTNTVAEQLASRGDFFRSQGGGPGGNGIGGVPEVQEDSTVTSPPTAASDGFVPGGREKDRPVSQYPLFGNIMDTGPRTAPPGTFHTISEQPDYFGIAAPRASSPEQFDGTTINVEAPSPNVPSLTSSIDSVQSNSQPRTREGTIGSMHSQKSLKSDRGLAAPRQSPRFPKSPRSMQSIRSVPQDSGDEDTASLNEGYAVTSSRKFSSSSNVSTPQSPFSPFVPSARRSPSLHSESSTTGGAPHQSLPRPPAFNFSRPLSSAGSLARQSIDARPPLSPNMRQPSSDLPFRKPSAPSVTLSSAPSSRQNSADEVPQRSPLSAAPSNTVDSNEAGSYTYAKYSLPRGREVDRTSFGRPPTNEWILGQFDWTKGPPADAKADTKAPETTPQPVKDLEKERKDSQSSQASSIQRPASAWERRTDNKMTPKEKGSPEAPIKRPASAWDRSPEKNPFPRDRNASGASTASAPRPRSAWGQEPDAQEPVATDASIFYPPMPELRRPPSPPRPDLMSGGRTGRSLIPDPNPVMRSRSADPRVAPNRDSVAASIQTESTDRTIRASKVPLHQRALSTDLTPDEHLEIGIQAHSAGHLTKSTYHLRRAAHAGLPTGMLLYALACRHGWGMRANQADGVMWLRRAIDSSSSGGLRLEDAITPTVRLVESKGPITAAASAQETRNRKAQLSLAVYELGISYMNGWGCPKDKALAVRCYEVAGNWGDCDALAEAGFCYTQGLGVKKDLKKAAQYYRQAADGGMSMAGNSWIYKPKYMDAAPPGSPLPPNSSSSSVKGDKDKSKTPDKSSKKDSSAAEGQTKTRSRARSLFGGRRKEKN